MLAYGSHQEVADRIPTGTACDGSFTEETKPKASVVAGWVVEVSARLDGWIRMAGYDPTTVTDEARPVLVEAVTEYVAGQVERYVIGREASYADGVDPRKKPLADLAELLAKNPSGAAK